MTNAIDGTLLYRATRDSFNASAFHRLCNGEENTLTIIQTNSNYVFGGYSSEKWANGCVSDSSAFIFSLRRNGISQVYKFLITQPKCAIFGHPNYGPTFGGGHEIYVRDRSDIHIGSYSNFSTLSYYEQPYTNIEEKNCFLAGNKQGWLTTEIEVYKIDEKIA
jgi:hypothetical protein